MRELQVGINQYRVALHTREQVQRALQDGPVFAMIVFPSGVTTIRVVHIDELRWLSGERIEVAINPLRSRWLPVSYLWKEPKA